MYENAKEELLGTGVVGASAQGGAQLPLVLRERSFGMDSMMVDLFGESALQLAAIVSRGPFSSAARIDRDHQGADPDLATQLMVGFAVVGHVGEDAVPVDSQGTVQDGWGEFRGIVTRPQAHLGGHPQVTGRVAQDGQLGESRSEEGLRVGPLVAIVDAGVPGFVPRGIHGALGFELDQAAAVGSITDRIEESIEAPFFKSRL